MQFRALIDRVGSSLQQLTMPEQCTEATFKVLLDRLESKPFVIERFSLLKIMWVPPVDYPELTRQAWHTDA